MFPARAFPCEQKGAVLQEDRIAGVIHPGPGRLAKESGRGAALVAARAEIEPGLGAILHVEKDLLTIRRPAGTDNEGGGRRITKIHPARGTTARRHNAELDQWIGIAGLG